MKKIILILAISLALLAVGYKTSLAARFIAPQNNDNQNINIHSKTVNDNLFVYGKDVNINSPVKGDLFVFGSNVHINQPVTGNIFIIGVSTTINSEISHDAFIYAKELDLKDNAKILGSFYARTSQINKFSATQILGSTRISQSTKKVSPQKHILTQLASFLAMLLVGLLLLKFLPQTLHKAIESSRHDWGKSVLISVLAFFLAPIIVALLAVTIVGIPLAIILGLIFVIDIYLGAIVIAYVIGKFICKNKLTDQLILLIGLVIMRLLGSNHYTEPLATLLILYGFGLLLNAKFKIFEDIRENI